MASVKFDIGKHGNDEVTFKKIPKSTFSLDLHLRAMDVGIS